MTKSFALLALVFVFASCSKYEEGSKFTVLTKKARMVNTWTLISYTYNGNAQTLSGTSSWKLEKDGKATASYVFGNFTTTDIGTWDFNSDKSKLVLTDSSGDIEEFVIVQLKNKDLKLKQTDTDGNVSIGTYKGE